MQPQVSGVECVCARKFISVSFCVSSVSSVTWTVLFREWCALVFSTCALVAYAA